MKRKEKKIAKTQRRLENMGMEVDRLQRRLHKLQNPILHQDDEEERDGDDE
jgi:biotin operon repressor